MTAASKKILQFIKKNIPIAFSKQRLSVTSKRMITEIINTMKTAVYSYDKNASFREHVLKDDELPKGNDYEYIVDEIKNELNHNKTIGKKYSFTINSRTFTIYAVYPYKQSENTIDKDKIYNVLDKAIKKKCMYGYLLQIIFQKLIVVLILRFIGI